MIDKCIRCDKCTYSERPDMYFCKVRQTLINTTFADAHHECFVPRKAPEQTEVFA